MSPKKKIDPLTVTIRTPPPVADGKPMPFRIEGVRLDKRSGLVVLLTHLHALYHGLTLSLDFTVPSGQAYHGTLVCELFSAAGLTVTVGETVDLQNLIGKEIEVTFAQNQPVAFSPIVKEVRP